MLHRYKDVNSKSFQRCLTYWQRFLYKNKIKQYTVQEEYYQLVEWCWHSKHGVLDLNIYFCVNMKLGTNRALKLHFHRLLAISCLIYAAHHLIFHSCGAIDVQAFPRKANIITFSLSICLLCSVLRHSFLWLKTLHWSKTCTVRQNEIKKNINKPPGNFSGNEKTNWNSFYWVINKGISLVSIKAQ